MTQPAPQLDHDLAAVGDWFYELAKKVGGDVRVAVAKNDGSPDWTAPTAPCGDIDPIDVSEAARWCVVVNRISGCPSVNVIAYRRGSDPMLIATGGDLASQERAKDLVHRDITGSALPANDNVPDQVKARLQKIQRDHGGELVQRGESWIVRGVSIEGLTGQAWIDDRGAAVLWTSKCSVEIDETKPVTPRFELTWFDDISDSKPKETIIKGAFGVGEFSVVSGLPGTGKSVILTDAACHVAAGMEWHGRRVRQGLVVYVAAERKDLTERRLLAFRKRHDVLDVPLVVVGGRLDLTRDLVDATALADAISVAQESAGAPCVWIIIDTLTRTFGAGDQNASKDMVKFVASADELVRRTGAHVTVVHHTSWAGERAKGAIDLDGAVDASFLVKKTASGYLLTCDGANDGPEGDVVRFNMESVEVGVDEDGEPTMAPVVVPAAATLAEGLVAAHKGHTAKALEALLSTIETQGVEPEGSHYPSDVLVVTEEQWRAAYYEAHSTDKPETLQKRFMRAKRALLEAGSAKQVGQWTWH